MNKGRRIMKTMLALCMAVMMVMSCFITSNAAKSRGYSFKYNRASATPGSSATNFIKKAGSKVKPTRTKSCAYKGQDSTYKYSNFTLKTYSNKKGGTEYVSSLVITSSNVSTPEGVKIGSSEKTVTKKYGKAKAKFGVYTYTKGKTKLLITVENKKVTEIEYTKK